ncbi:MAG TPA: lysylphosphatidylglycerol synthase transmembrane domain-containing protein [Gaiellaceae bacterium]|nr:lysylphosphatidylglycerol synthase transmembrane domain-containing protein [Gaiellaceae bacterium]
MGRRQLAILVGIVSLAGLGLLVARTGTHTFQVAATPDWRFLLAGLAICAAVQPLRALAWTSTVRSPVGFRAMYAASSVGSFLDTVLPGRMGEASKVAVLKVAAGPRWPGFSRAGGSLLCAHLLEMIAFVLVGAGSAFFLPIPGWARITMLVGLPAAAGGLVLVSVLHKRVSHRLPDGVGSFLAGAAAPKGVMLRAGVILVLTWVARWFGILFLLHAVGVHVGIGAALLYMVVTGLANTMPFLPGNVGLYQGAALGALAMAGHGGTTAAAASVFTPAAASLATAIAAMVGLAFYGRRLGELRRAAVRF